jgi:hypothetical protein
MSPFKGNRGVTPAPTEYDKGLGLAFKLLQGDTLIENGRLVEERYLSPRTKPTEKEGREALAKSLLAIAAKMKFDEALLLAELAQLFDPRSHKLAQRYLGFLSDPTRTVDFKRVSKGHAKPSTHFQIAWEVEKLSPNGKGKGKAVKAVAKKYSMEERTVYRICRSVARVTDIRLAI